MIIIIKNSITLLYFGENGLIKPFLMNKFAPVKVAAFKSVDKSFRSGDIGGNGNIMNVAKTKKSIIIRVGNLIHGVAEEKKKIYLVAGNAGSYLFASAVAAAEKFRNVKTGRIGNKLSGS